MLKIYAPAGHLGHGVPRESLRNALKLEPDVVAIQGTSTDYGPYYLGANKIPQSLAAIERDLETLLSMVNGIPLIMSCAGPGTDHTLKTTLRLLGVVARRLGLRLDVYVVSGEIEKRYLLERLERGVRVRRAVETPHLSEYLTFSDVREAERVVGQMGVEPIIRGLESGADVICTGRALDTALFAAYPLMMGYDKGLVMHMSKILECGALSAEPPTSADGMFAILEKDYFIVFPTNPRRRATVDSVAAHSFYERDDPTREWGNDGYLDLSQAVYEQYDDRSVLVSGARWVPSGTYTVKIEGAKFVGYRAIMVCGARDPRFISNIDEIIEDVRRRVAKHLGPPSELGYELHFHLYGRDGVLGPLEPVPNLLHELGILVEVVAKSRSAARDVCSYVRSLLFHIDHPELRGLAGNLAFPFSPMVLDAGEVYTFNIYHLLPLEDPLEPFRSRMLTLGAG